MIHVTNIYWEKSLRKQKETHVSNPLYACTYISTRESSEDLHRRVSFVVAGALYLHVPAQREV